MKNIILLILLVANSIHFNAQNTITERKVVPILAPQTFFLNSQTNATFGGKNRTNLEINLPKNTVEWYYSFTTTKDMSSPPALNLLAQVTKLYDPTGITAMATTTLFSPSGVSVCDIFLLDKNNAKAFIDKGNKWRNTYNFIASGTRENYTNGTITITNPKTGTYYLGFKNPSLTEGLSVTVEVVAIIEEFKKVEPTDNENKANLFANLAQKALAEHDYDKALELFSKVIHLNNNADVYHKTGLIYLIQNNYSQAIDHYSNAIILAKKQKNAKALLKNFVKQIEQYNSTNTTLTGSLDVIHLLNSEIKKIK